MASLAKVRAELELQHYLEERAKKLHSLAARGGIASLDPEEARSRNNLDSVLVPLVTSRLCCAEELRALTVTSRLHCRSLGKFEALAPLFELLLRGFAEMRGLADGASSSLKIVEDWNDSVRARLESLTKAELVALKAEALLDMPTRPAACRVVLEVASQLLQPNEKAHDDFAVRRLANDLRAAERALACGPTQVDQIHPVLRQRVSKQIALHSDAITALAVRDDATGALAEWLQLMHEALVEYPKIRGMYRTKEAVAGHIVSLAKWALRPHGRLRLCGRMVPPPAPPLPQKATAPAIAQVVSAPMQPVAPPTSSRHPAAPNRHYFVPPRPQTALPRSRGAAQPSCAGTGGLSTPSQPLDGSRGAPTVPALGGRQSIAVEVAQQLQREPGPAGVGLGAGRAVELWLREFGQPGHRQQQQLLPAQHADEACDELPAAAYLAAAAEHSKARRSTNSSCSTASTEEGEGYMASRSAASSTVGCWSAPCSTFHSPVLPAAQTWPAPTPLAAQPAMALQAVLSPDVASLAAAASFAATAATEGPCAELELSSDDEDVFEIGRGPSRE